LVRRAKNTYVRYIYKRLTTQSSFPDGIEAKLRAVKQALNSTVVSVTNNFMTISATLTKVEEDTTRMSVLLEENVPDSTS
jgi:hypothetical protein